MSQQPAKPSTIIWTSIFCITAGGILVAINSWFGWLPITYGAIMLLVGLVTTRDDKTLDESTETRP